MKLLAQEDINIILWDKSFAKKSRPRCQDCTGDDSQLSSNFLAMHKVTGKEAGDCSPALLNTTTYVISTRC